MHENFAKIYDEFTKHVDYKAWYKFLRRYIKKKDKLLDIGCGTASLTSFFVQDGFCVTGLDISQSMIDEALKKVNIRYICQDIEEKGLDEHFKYIICNFDTVNYFSSISKFISNCSKMQKEGDILIFDVVLDGIFDEIFDENGLFLDEESNYTAIWTHKKLKNKHRINIDMFIKIKDNVYEKYSEIHNKYIYEVDDIVNILNENGYYLYDIGKNDKFGQSRLFIIAKK